MALLRKHLAAILLLIQGAVSPLWAPVRSPAPQQRPKPTIAVQQPASRIFTPNGDGRNDTFTLTIDNPSGSILSQKKIYDLRGGEVADFEVIGDETAATVTLVWNGRDKDGNEARSGIYIYQVQAEGQVINGTVVVAR